MENTSEKFFEQFKVCVCVHVRVSTTNFVPSRVHEADVGAVYNVTLRAKRLGIHRDSPVQQHHAVGPHGR